MDIRIHLIAHNNYGPQLLNASARYYLTPSNWADSCWESCGNQTLRARKAGREDAVLRA
ncbi:MAG TPA: hypothetical protein VJ761_23420 [Ktedonobacteraceae bacterium]|nr:hypothetical protein [Ktedonobacteraceae bacterium]